jgi:hypothetical protein
MAYGDSGSSEVDGSESQDTKVGTDTDLLSLVAGEMVRAVGFDQDAELRDDRERALLYRKGDVSADIPTLPNRSKAVSSDISDAIETIKPDLIEIFTAGDDVVAFIPQNARDVEAAKQETAYLHHVAFQDNPGFLNLCTAIDDALGLKQGIFHWEWEEDITHDYEDFTGKNAVELQLAQQDGEVTDIKAETEGADLRTGEQTYSFRVTKTKDNSKATYWAIAPDDFAAAPDTVYIAEATYCVERQRPRVQDLIAEGFDEEKVRNLPAYGEPDTTIQQARDTAGEHETPDANSDDTSDDLRQVEIRKHCIRVLGKNNKLELWCIYTDAQATIELHREEINAIPYACGSPYLVAHRLIGRSLADLLIEVMKIKTALYRMVLDSGYFAINQRSEVAMDKANEFTISDLLRNEPMVPVRSRSGDAVRPLQQGALGFDAYAAIEFFSTVAEGRTGVVRNAQGLNPDTLHDTAKGAMVLLSAAQKRTRMIARVLAETLIKPLFLGLHACIRENGTATREAQLLGKWVPVDPTKWAERNAMTVEVGLGAAGKDAEIAAINQISLDMKEIVAAQGSPHGPIVNLKNIYKLATDKAKKLGVKAPDEYYTDPTSPEGQAAIQAMAQQPNPEVMKVQGEQQLQQSKQQGEMALGQMKVQAEKEIQANKSQFQAAADQHKQELEHQRELQKHADMMQLEQIKIASAERIAIATARIRAEGQIAAAEAKGNAQAASDALAFEQSHETTTA